MILYLVQHGKALSKEVDPDRALSVEGRSEVEAVANCLARAGVSIPRIYHSGKTRAAQTARILADKLTDGHVEMQSGMAPNDDVAAFASIIEGKNRDALYIGHLPHLGKLVSCSQPETNGPISPVSSMPGYYVWGPVPVDTGSSGI